MFIIFISNKIRPRSNQDKSSKSAVLFPSNVGMLWMHFKAICISPKKKKKKKIQKQEKSAQPLIKTSFCIYRSPSNAVWKV